MSFAHVATGISNTLSSNIVTSDAINTTGATLLVVVASLIDSFSTLSGGISDSKVNTWVNLPWQQINPSGGSRVRISYCLSPIVGSGHTVTFDPGATFHYPLVALMAFNGFSAAFDAQTGTVDQLGNSQVHTGSITPAVDNSVLITGICEQVSSYTVPTIDSSFTVAADKNATTNGSQSMAVGYKIQTAKGAENPQWTVDGSTSGAAAVIGVFNPFTPSAPFFINTDLLNGGMQALSGGMQ